MLTTIIGVLKLQKLLFLMDQCLHGLVLEQECVSKFHKINHPSIYFSSRLVNLVSSQNQLEMI